MKRFAVVARLIRPNWRYVAQSFFVLVPMMGLSLPGPFITKLLIDDVYSQKDETLMALVLVAFGSKIRFASIKAVRLASFRRPIHVMVAALVLMVVYRIAHHINVAVQTVRRTVA